MPTRKLFALLFLAVILTSIILPITIMFPLPTANAQRSSTIPLTIAEVSGHDLTGYPVKVVLDYTYGYDISEIASDLTNIYFTDNSGNPLYYWIEGAYNRTALTVIQRGDYYPGVYWKYTTTDPPPNWYTLDFDDSSWSIGEAPIGNTNKCRTKIDFEEIYLRKKFIIPRPPRNATIILAYLHVATDDGADVWINGQKVMEDNGEEDSIYVPEYFNKGMYITNYLHFGENLIAAHVTDVDGADDIFDAMLIVVIKTDSPSSIVMWVKMNLTAYSTKTIYMHYGGTNPYGNYNDPEQMFIFFDDFKGDSLDTSKWIQTGGTATISNSVLSFYSGTADTPYYIYNDALHSPPVALRVKAKIPEVNPGVSGHDKYVGFSTAPTDSTPDSFEFGWWSEEGKHVIHRQQDGSDSRSYGSTLEHLLQEWEWFIGDILYVEPGYVHYSLNGHTRPVSDSYTMDEPVRAVIMTEGDGYIYVDWILIRPLVVPEPAVNIPLNIQPDSQVTKPRVRFWGTTTFKREYQDLSSPLILKAPSRDWHLYFYDGRLSIKRVHIEPIITDLVEDENITHGKLAKMYENGLITNKTFYTENAEVKELDIIPGTDIADILSEEGIENSDNYIATVSLTHFVPPPYFWEGHAWTGTVINIPLDKPISIYDNITMQLSTSIHTTSLAYDKNKRALGVLGLPVEVGGGVGISATAYSKIANKVLVWYASKHAVDVAKVAGVATSQSAAKVAGVVGIAIAVWGGIDAALIKWGGFGDVNIQNWLIIAPTVEDSQGNKYTAIQLILPLEESDNVEKYYDIFTNYFKDLGYADVGFRVDYPCKTWDEYKTLLSAGYSPQIKLDDLIEETIVAKHGLNINELKIKGVDVIIVTAVRAKETFWEWLAGLGGVDFDTVTFIGTATIAVKGKLKSRTITDPSEIATLLGNITINGEEHELLADTNGAYTEFSFPTGVFQLAIDFGEKTGYFADLEINTTVLVMKEFEPLEDFGYTAKLHYDWNALIRINKIEFVDMPYPMLKAERTFVYTYGNFTHDITDAFEFAGQEENNLSPTGIFYYYMTRENTKYIDPANGGIMQPCKTYIFNYFYKEPPDVNIVVYLNGTKVTSTLAHHATVVLSSSSEQDVKYDITFRVKYYEGLQEKTLMEMGTTAILHISANGTAYKIYDITQFVDAAIEFMRSQNKTAFVEIEARIIDAPKNYYKTNDEYKVVYYPPPLPSPVPPGVYNVTVKVYEYVLENNTWIPSPNANVEVYYGTMESELQYNAITDENGEANLILEAGTWTFKAYKKGFVEAKLTTPIYNNTVIQLYLSPLPQPPSENRTYVEENITVTLNVYDATTGSAIQGANITLVFTEPTNSSYYGMSFNAITDSNGKAEIKIPIGFYNITVDATGYLSFKEQYLLDKDTTVNIAMVQEGINLTDYASLEVRVYYSDGKPYTGAHVEIYNATDGSLIAMLITDSYGNATMLLPINQDYNITVKISEPLYNRSYTDSKIITLTQDTIVTFIVPWKSPQPPQLINEIPYYWLSVQVVWENGLPFHGAVVEAFNYTSEQLIDSLVTNGTGTVHFLLPAFQKYIIRVNATNPYNATQNYQATFIVNLTDNRWITIELPWLPEETQLAKQYRVYVYAYDVTDGSGIPRTTVILRKGDIAWVAETDETGHAEIWVPFLGLYNITGIHPSYDAVWRNIQIYENNTLINLPMSPAIIPQELYPPLNGTEYPPVYINGTPYYWLSVQVLYNDGYPYHGANVTVYDLETNTSIATGVTNGTGFVHFLIPANKNIKYTVDAVNPESTTETYHTEKTLNITQHYYFVHVLPWASEYYSPEVFLQELHFIIHRGQGYFFGNVSHLVLLTIWTNKPQNVTILIGLYNVTGNTWIQNKTVTLTLEEGVNTFFEWFSINASIGGKFKIFANITQYEYDTDPTNNWLWSEEQFLKPQVDIQVFILWRPVKQKQPWSLLPEDIIEIDIGIRLPINTSTIPAKLEWIVEKYDLKNLVYEIERGAEEEVRTVKPGMVWRNITVVVPWTSKIVVTANVTHEWEDFGYNNFVNVTISIDPDVKIELVDVPSVVMEGSIFKVTVNVTSNVEPGKGIGWVSLVDNTTATLIKRVEIELAPQKTVEIEAKAPENPSTFWIFRAPTTTHQVTAQFAGYDLYLENNKDEFTLTVMSYQWLTIIAGIIVIIAILASIKAVTHTIHDIRNKKKKFVKRRTSFLTESIHELKDEYKYVKKKNNQV